MKTLNREIFITVLIYPYLMNGITVWGNSGTSNLCPVIILQKRSCCVGLYVGLSVCGCVRMKSVCV